MSPDGNITEPAPIPSREEEKESSVGQSGPTRPPGTTRKVTSGARRDEDPQQPIASPPRPTGAASTSSLDAYRNVDNARSVLGPGSGTGGARLDGAPTEKRSVSNDLLGSARRVGGADGDFSRPGLGWSGRGADGSWAARRPAYFSV